MVEKLGYILASAMFFLVSASLATGHPGFATKLANVAFVIFVIVTAMELVKK